ncbi:DUF4054 domain-containing protein [Megamonas funiformis]|uniref:DUF4054 domain-containing protein n=1 Tax=Megamonas funiformis TaxID=437897 RepID=UPI00267538C7|nr:DUF4054 domain-containing protein [Megamonas funiformis]
MYDKILDLIRKIAPEFNEITDEKLEGFIDVYADLVSKRYFGKHYNKAITFLVAHQLTLLNIASNSEAGAGDISLIAGDVLMEKEGDLQRQYGNVNTSDSETNSLLNKTYYGKMFISLRSALRPIGMMRKCP